MVTARCGDSVKAIMASQGAMPIPPYIANTRAADDRDRTDYQTVYAKREGAVAAPTAGLHFTPQLLEALAAKGVPQRFRDAACGRGHFPPGKS